MANIKIGIIGVGGAGGNAVASIQKQLQLVKYSNVRLIIANTDRQDLDRIDSSVEKVQLGALGLGAGMDASVGANAADSTRSSIAEKIQGLSMLIVVAGFGGGTGTGATPVVVQEARKQNILTHSIILYPPHFEGGLKQNVAEKGLEELEKTNTSYQVVYQDSAYKSLDKDADIDEVKDLADETLRVTVKAILSAILDSGDRNIDFADMSRVLTFPGRTYTAIMEGDTLTDALYQLENNPFVDQDKIENASGMLINIKRRDTAKITNSELTETMDGMQLLCAKDAIFKYGTQRLEADKLQYNVEVTMLVGASNTISEENKKKFGANVVKKATGGKDIAVKVPKETSTQSMNPNS
jgi:cell division protein FtsZ